MKGALKLAKKSKRISKSVLKGRQAKLLAKTGKKANKLSKVPQPEPVAIEKRQRKSEW